MIFNPIHVLSVMFVSLAWAGICILLLKVLGEKTCRSIGSVTTLTAMVILAIVPPLVMLLPFSEIGALRAVEGALESLANNSQEFRFETLELSSGRFVHNPFFQGLSVTAWAATAIYFSGLCFFLSRLCFRSVRVYRLVQRAKPWSNTRSTQLLLTDENVSPFSYGVFRRRIILPEALVKTLSDEELSMIIQHEQQHLSRHDPTLFFLLSCVETVCWINPFISMLTARCRLAAEIACDHEVLANAPSHRGGYAQMLVTVLKSTAGNALPSVPAIFSPQSQGDHKMRIIEIMAPSGRVGKVSGGKAMIAALLFVGPIGFAAAAFAETVRDLEVAVVGIDTSSALENETLQLAYDTLVGGDPATARQLLDGEINSGRLSDAELATAYEMRGSANARLGDYAAALSDFEAAIETGALSSAERVQLGYYVAQLKYQAQDYEGAIPGLLEYIEGNPDDAIAHYLLGAAYAMLEDFEKAKQYAERAVALDPDHVEAAQLLEFANSKLS